MVAFCVTAALMTRGEQSIGYVCFFTIPTLWWSWRRRGEPSGSRFLNTGDIRAKIQMFESSYSRWLLDSSAKRAEVSYLLKNSITCFFSVWWLVHSPSIWPSVKGVFFSNMNEIGWSRKDCDLHAILVVFHDPVPRPYCTGCCFHLSVNTVPLTPELTTASDVKAFSHYV